MKSKQIEQSKLLDALQSDPQYIQKMASKVAPNPTGSNFVTLPLAPIDQNIPVSKASAKPQNGHPKEAIATNIANKGTNLLLIAYFE